MDLGTDTRTAYEGVKGAIGETRSAAQKYASEYVSPELFGVYAKKGLYAAGPSTELRKSEAKLKGELSRVYSEYAAPDKYPEITNPLIRAKAADVRAASLRTQIGTVQAQRREAEGTIMDWITEATAGIKATNERLKIEWGIKKEGFEMALKEYGIVSEAEAARRADEWAAKNYEMEVNKFEESKRQFEEQMKFNREQLAATIAASRSGGGGGSRSEAPTKWETERSDEAVMAALDVFAREDIRNVDTPDKMLSPWERENARKSINAIGKQYGIPGDELYDIAWNQGGFKEWNPPEAEKPAQRSPSLEKYMWWAK